MKKHIEQTLRQVIAKFPADAEPIMTDILLYVDSETGEFQAFNDDDVLLASSTAKELAGMSDDAVVQVLRNSIGQFRGAFLKTSLMQPFSFVLIDKEHEVLQDLVVIDSEETMVIDVNLLDGFEEDLDVFLKQLLED